MNKSETQKYVQGLQKENKELNNRICDYEEKMQKCQEEYKKFFEDTPFGWEIDKIAKDIRERQDNAMAMEFAQKIGQMLRENGVVPHITKYKTEAECTENSVKQRYGVEFDRLDFTEHDNLFKDEIKQLKHNLREAEVRLREKEEYEKYLESTNGSLERELMKKRGEIDKLESELDVKDNLLKIKNGIHQEKPRIHIIGLREFGGEQYMRYSDVEELIKELESR